VSLAGAVLAAAITGMVSKSENGSESRVVVLR
jgi:hypothetical protein